jgi:hypothetical protein
MAGDWFTNLVNDFSSGVKGAASEAYNYVTSEEGLLNIGAVGLNALAKDKGWNDPEIPRSGYQGSIPALRAVRGEVPMMRGEAMSDGTVIPTDQAGLTSLTNAQPTGRMVNMAYDPNRRPGSSGRRYFSDVQYIGKNEDPTAAQASMQEQIAQLAERNTTSPARETRQPQQMASGGIAALKKGKYLDGDTDGMADKVSATIEGRQPAALSDGEFVIPADVVSHLGNGNSDAGAKVLEEMMARVRKARTGRKEQGKEINASKILPA